GAPDVELSARAARRAGALAGPQRLALGGGLSLAAWALRAHGRAARRDGERRRGAGRALLPGARAQVVPVGARAPRRGPGRGTRGLPPRHVRIADLVSTDAVVVRDLV